MNTGAPLMSGYFTTSACCGSGCRIRRHSMCSWRAGCGGTRKSGSAGSGEETTGRKAGIGASPLTQRQGASREDCCIAAKEEPEAPGPSAVASLSMKASRGQYWSVPALTDTVI